MNGKMHVNIVDLKRNNMENKKKEATLGFVNALEESVLSYNKIYEDIAEYESGKKEMNQEVFSSILERMAWERQSSASLSDDTIEISDEFFDLVKDHYSRDIVFALIKKVKDFNAMTDEIMKPQPKQIPAWEVSLRSRRIEKYTCQFKIRSVSFLDIKEKLQR